MIEQNQAAESRVSKAILWLCAGLALATAIFPFTRAFFRIELNFNEGWNLYNASRVVSHEFLYPVKYGWTTVNYPMLSFVLMAQTHRFTHEYLFTARVVSLLGILGSSCLVGLIVHRLHGTRRAALLSGFFTLALFCTAATPYVGMDDPQILAQVFFLAGFAVYLKRRESLPGLFAAALLFAIGGSIKHSPIDFPLAVLIDLLLLSFGRALWFGACGLALAAVAVWANIHWGGPFFLAQLLSPRRYSASYAVHSFVNVFRPLCIPLVIALYTAFRLRVDKGRRIAAILLVAGMLVGGYFGGGEGVSINSVFTALLAMAILLGLFFSELDTRREGWTMTVWAPLLPLLVFASLLFPWLNWARSNPVRTFSQLAPAQASFDEEVAMLAARPGPALCESLLRCSLAGKPYVYDPFNATRLIHFGKLDANVVLSQIHQQAYGAIQLSQPVEEELSHGNDRFDESILVAIEAEYTPILSHPGVVIYVPLGRAPNP